MEGAVTSKAWQRALADLIARECPDARVERTAGGHVRIVMGNGRCVVTSGSPSDWRALLNTRAQLRRTARQSR